MSSRWFETILCGLIGSLMGCAVGTYLFTHLHGEHIAAIDRINHGLGKMDYALEGFDMSAAELMNAINELAEKEIESRQREEKFY